MKKKNVTIDELAVMVQKEFDGIHQKLGKLDKLEKNDQAILKRLEIEKTKRKIAERAIFVSARRSPPSLKLRRDEVGD